MIDPMRVYGQLYAQAAGEAPGALPEGETEEQTNLLELLQKELERQQQELVKQQQKKQLEADLSASALKEKYGSTKQKPHDPSGGLTARLVSAGVESQVGAVIAEAGSSISSLRMVAAQGEGDDADKARAYIKKLEKLIQRARRKITDLRGEDVAKSRQRKAEQQHKQKRVEKIKYQLKQKQVRRAARENSYLLDRTDPSSLYKSRDPREKDMEGATAAQIAQIAREMAFAEAAFTAAETEGATAAEQAEASTGEVAAGGEGIAAGSEGGGLDISV